MKKNSIHAQLKKCNSTCLISLLSVALGGCAHSPSLNVLGAYFPDWMFCIMGSLALTILVYQIVVRLGWDRHSDKFSTVFFYPTLSIIFALGSWLAFFQN